jgi:hypothetical protein
MIGTLLHWVSLLGFLVLGLLGMPICVGAVIIPLAPPVALLMWALVGFRKAFRTCSGAVIGMTAFCLN